MRRFGRRTTASEPRSMDSWALKIAYHRRAPSGLHDEPNSWPSVLHVLLRGLGSARSCMHVPGRGQCGNASMPLRSRWLMKWQATAHACTVAGTNPRISPYVYNQAPITDVEVSTPFVDARRHRRSIVSLSWSPGRLEPPAMATEDKLTTCSTPRYCQLRKVQLQPQWKIAGGILRVN